jgi:hypothetical protein
MTVTIGRAVLDDAVSNVQQQGDLLSFDVTITNATTGGLVSSGQAVRQQLLGMMNNEDEDVFPVLSTDDPSWDGYYRVQSINVEPFPVFLSSGAMRASFALQRVGGGYANPAIENYVVSRVATNAHGITSPTYALAISHPRGPASIQLDRTGLPDATFLRQPIGIWGEINNYYDTGSNFEGYSIAYSDPSEYYTNDCRIQYSGGGVTVGRQFPPIAINETWSMSNGFIWALPSGADNEIDVGVWDPVAMSVETFAVRAGTISAGSFTASTTHSIVGASVAPIVLRNSPETISLRVTNGVGEPTFTFTMWRGSMILQVTVDTPTAANVALGIAPTAAGTNITGGVRTTSNNGSGNRFVILNRAAVTTSTTHTAAAATTATTRSVFGIAVQRGGSSATNPWQDSDLLQQLCAPPQWQQRVSER